MNLTRPTRPATAGLAVVPVGSMTLSDEGGQGERARTRFRYRSPFQGVYDVADVASEVRGGHVI